MVTGTYKDDDSKDVAILKRVLESKSFCKEMEESFDQEVMELDDNDFEEYHNAIEEQKQLDEKLGDE